MKLVVAILSGIARSKHPLISRENYPKPFIKFSDNESLLQKTLLRNASLSSVEEIFTITNRKLLY